MITLTIDKIFRLIGDGTLKGQYKNIEITGVSIDSRITHEGDVFFALAGARDGHEFCEKALEKGAKALVVSKQLDLDVPQIIVEDTLYALGEFARNYRSIFDIKVVAVSGSVGKTTTREMTKQVLKRKFNVISAPSNYNNLIGLPLTIFSIDNNTEIAILELGINQPNEMERLCEIADPDIGIITTIAPVHLELLGDLEGVANEKIKLFEYVSQKDGKCIYNSDDELLTKYAQPFHENLVTFGVISDADYIADHINISSMGSPSFNLEKSSVSLNIYGVHNVYNALAAYVIGLHFGIETANIADSLSNYKAFKGRMQRYDIGNTTIFDDTYNASPTAMISSITTLISIPARKRIIILGDMFELGDKAIEYHKEIIDFALKNEINRIFLLGDLFKEASRDYSSDKLMVFDDKETLLDILFKEVCNHCVILVKGSRAMKMEKITKMILENEPSFLSESCEELQ